MKTRLALYLGVPKQRITNWLNGNRYPNGESVLRLLEWVTAEEAKQRTLAGVSRTHKGEQTRKRKSENENLKSGPKKSK